MTLIMQRAAATVILCLALMSCAAPKAADPAKTQKASSPESPNMAAMRTFFEEASACQGQPIDMMTVKAEDIQDIPTRPLHVINKEHEYLVEKKFVPCLMQDEQGRYLVGIDRAEMKDGTLVVVKNAARDQIVLSYLFLLSNETADPDDVEYWYRKSIDLMRFASNLGRASNDFLPTPENHLLFGHEYLGARFSKLAAYLIEKRLKEPFPPTSYDEPLVFNDSISVRIARVGTPVGATGKYAEIVIRLNYAGGPPNPGASAR